jgi:hypothetical protein
MHGLLQFHDSDILKINKILENDAEFLNGLFLLDYSLLIGIERKEDLFSNVNIRSIK